MCGGESFLDPFQFRFRPGFGTDYACQEIDSGITSLLILLDISADLSTIDLLFLCSELALNSVDHKNSVYEISVD